MKFQRLIFIVALVWYAVTAYFSIGFFHPDEHYQIIEFAGIIDKPETSKDLTWEFKTQIRPALQPVICYLIFKACDFFSISDPYNKAFVLRLITGWLAVLIIRFFTNSLNSSINDKFRNLFLILSYFIWFLPFINVRFSSETWSGLSFLLALSLIIRNNKNCQTYLIAGLMLGLSFIFRSQIAFAVLGLALWLVFIKKESAKNIIFMSTGGLVAILLGFLVDSWFYGDWVVTIWNYFKVNLIDGKTSEFGVSPWYYYIFYIFKFSFFPFGLIIILSFLFLIYKRFNSIFIWIILPFLIFHSFIPHKELRFLFPLVNLVPVVFILAIQEFPKVSWINPANKFIQGLVIFFLSANMTGAFVAGIKPVGIPVFRIAKRIHEMDNKKPINLYYVKNYKNNTNPFIPWGLVTNFYYQKEFRFNILELNNQTKISPGENQNLLVVSIEDVKNPEIQNFIKIMNMKEETRSIRKFQIPFLMIYGFNTRNLLILYSDE